MNAVLELFRRVWKADSFSATAFVARAVIIALAFSISELVGLREYTTFLTGTSANLNVSWQMAATLGLIHLLLYVALILLVPVSLITAGLLFGWKQWRGRQQRLPEQRESSTAPLPSPKVRYP